MSTIAFSGMLVFFVIILFMAFAYISKKQKLKATAMLLLQLNKSGEEQNLSFSSYELLTDSTLGLDEVNRKLLVMKHNNNGLFETNIIDLELVRTCAVNKIYKSVYDSGSNDGKIESFLDKIVVEVELIDSRKAIEIVFYQHVINNIYEMLELEKKAKKWEMLLLQNMANILSQRA